MLHCTDDLEQVRLKLLAELEYIIFTFILFYYD